MTDNQSANPQPIAGLPHPGPINRARFFASRHPIAVAVPLAVIIAFGIATLAGFVLDVTPERREVFIPGVAAISLTAIGAAIFPLVARMHSLAELDFDVLAFDQGQAVRSGLLRAATRGVGLSLGDRACLSAAASCNAVAVTTDRAWSKLGAGIAIEVLR